MPERGVAGGEADQLYRALMESAWDAIFVLDADTGDVIEVNRKACELTGQGRQESRGRKVWELAPPAAAATIQGLFLRAASQAELLAEQVPFPRADGSTRWMDVSARRIGCDGREVVHAVIRDVSELHTLQERLREYASELERRVDETSTELRRSQANLVKSEKMAALGSLVAGVAHEINTPVGSIASSVQTAQRCSERIRAALLEPEGQALTGRLPELSKALRILDETCGLTRIACDRIHGIVQNLKNFVRLDEGTLKTVSIHEGLDSTIALAQHELKSRVRVERNYGEVPEVECHPNQLNQVFLNLLMNAAQAIAGEGVIKISTFHQPPWVAVEFEDSGVGIAPENIDRIFEPGFTTKPAGVGTGLGLPIANQIVEEHCGMLEVRSTPGKGSVFTVLLPARKC
jgi:PAS domain S-box-containing protein